jgi:chromosome segregation ATPase
MAEPISRYFAFTKRSIKGPFYPKDIALLPDFDRTTLVCQEAALGNWREAYLENTFQPLFDCAARSPDKAMRPLTHEAADDKAMRSLLEKAVVNNSRLETEVQELRREYSLEKERLENELGKKNTEIQALAERLKRTSVVQAKREEHPSWEHLYKILKKRADEKLFEATQAGYEKNEEILRLRGQMQNMVNTYEDSKRDLIEKTAKEREKTGEELKTLKSALEEKEIVIRTMAENVHSGLNKTEEFNRIIQEENQGYEEQNAGLRREVLRLQGQIQNMIDTYETSKHSLIEKTAKEREKTGEELKALKSALEEKEMVVQTMSDYLQSLLAKNGEFYGIMLDERRDSEAQNTRFCEEIGRLKGEVKWKEQELARLNSELHEAMNRIKEFESVAEIKTREQEEIFGVIHSKIGILSGYFENLESRLKYVFKKT